MNNLRHKSSAVQDVVAATQQLAKGRRPTIAGAVIPGVDAMRQVHTALTEGGSLKASPDVLAHLMQMPGAAFFGKHATHEIPEFSQFTQPGATAASPVAAEYHRAMLNRDRTVGGLGGAATGALLGHHLGGMPGAAVGGVLGGAGGTLAGHFSGTERYRGDEMRRARKVSDIERAQEHRKELIDMRKRASANTFDGIMLSAMANELAAIQQEKVAINLAPVGNFIGNMASRAATAAPKLTGALENIGGRLADRAVLGLAARPSAFSNKLLSGLNSAERAVGGTANFNRALGAGAVGTGALGTGLLANRMLRRPQQTTTVNVQR